MERIICGNSNMHNITMEESEAGVSSRCTLKNPCNCCLMSLGRKKLKELIKSGDASLGDKE